ncbi:MAG: hypothetical protein IT376_03390 [Polyangiaceae bacterium]|nr:hypothetical protein [Polyangiaceae bacterium]
MKARDRLGAAARLGALWLVGLAACSETPITLPLRSLERSGDVAFVCTGAEGAGRSVDGCPGSDPDGTERRLLALVTQTRRGEVAVVDVTAGSVVDVDRSTPGFSFVPVGAQPRDLVATPGGVATFVGVAESGKEGIVAIPSTCARGVAPDLLDLPACALPSAPGAMTILIDGEVAGLARERCDAPREAAASEPGRAVAASGRRCPADLALESSPAGRRKLVVALPELSELAVFDAQEILDREPGTYSPCVPERVIALDVALPPTPIAQRLPPDLAELPACVGSSPSFGPAPAVYLPRPSDLALQGDTLYVSDLDAPVVHLLEASSPCELAELPPLLPMALDQPTRVVTTSRVAVSPLTSTGRRFAYAVDAFDGSTMVFDVTAGSSERTPVVRPGAARLPFEPADRIAFSSRAHDLDFALRDVPIADPVTGLAVVGARCDPDPALDSASPGARYRTALDFTTGAAPRKLRGVFGFLALANGQVAVIDVEDFDAPCRRPISLNPAAEPDYRGCAGDPASPAFYTDDGTDEGRRTVSGEVSCGVVQPHRARTSAFAVSSDTTGVRAPALRNFPRLVDALGGALAVDREDDEPEPPQLLGVDFSGGEPAEVYVGTSRYQRGGQNDLVIDPGLAERASVTLSFIEPRSYAPEEEITVAYEGQITGTRTTGLVRADGSFPDDARYCDLGVQDEGVVRGLGEELGVAADRLGAFAERHADYVQLTGALPDPEQTYWREGVGYDCAGAPGQGHNACTEVFGTADEPTPARDLRVVEAYRDRLVVAPRGLSGDEAARRLALVECCFPARAAYTIRAGHQWVVRGSASGFRHDIAEAPCVDGACSLRCTRSCEPRRKLQRARAFEISSSACAIPSDPSVAPECAIGPADAAVDAACVVDGTGPIDPASPCVFENLTLRFAVYRGTRPSERDMAFSFVVTGGFAPLTASVAGSSASVLPESMVFVPQLGQLAVVDGSSAGLSFISLTSVTASRLYF